MNKKIIVVLLFLIIIIAISKIILNNTISEVNNNFVEKKYEDLNPISKESAKKILESEFGKDIINTEVDFKEDGDYYIIDVNVNIDNLEEHNSIKEPNSNIESHIINLGIYKINKYTGELSEYKNNG